MNHARHFERFSGMALYENPGRVILTLPDPPLTLAERRSFHSRRTRPGDSGLGLTTPTARKIGATVGSGLISAAPATGPAAPFVLAAGAIVTAISAIFHGADPRQVPDTQVTELADVAASKVYAAMSGETVADTGYGQVANATGPFPSGVKYPNVPYGAAGNPNLDPDQAAQQVQAISDAAKSQLQLAKSAQNTFYTSRVPNFIAIFGKMKAARASGQTAGGSAALSSVLSGATSGDSMLPYFLIGGGLLAVLASIGE